MERLAGVPTGTFQRLQEIQAQYPQRDAPGLEGYEESDRYYAEIFTDPELDALDNRLVFGWGCLTSLAQQLAGRFGNPNFGSLREADEVCGFLDAQGVDLQGVDVAKLDGVYWG